jgi:hypothetical protein
MRKPLLLACALAALPALSGARAACPADEAVERMALAIVENRPGEPLSGMTSLADGSARRTSWCRCCRGNSAGPSATRSA